tara:strand:+ start:226 stop:552 length:327 start_codon:yes stop_codon:yes gene_type:complete
MQKQNEIKISQFTFGTLEKVQTLITNPNEKIVGMVFYNDCKLQKFSKTSKRKYLFFAGWAGDIKSISTTDYETNELGEISVEIERDYRLGYSKGKELLIVTREEKVFK